MWLYSGSFIDPGGGRGRFSVEPAYYITVIVSTVKKSFILLRPRESDHYLCGLSESYLNGLQHWVSAI